jgi:hypothetical protein
MLYFVKTQALESDTEAAKEATYSGIAGAVQHGE